MEEIEVEVEEKQDEEPTIDWETFAKVVAKLAEAKHEWAGIPLPLEDQQLVLEPRYPYAGLADISDAAQQAKRHHEAAKKLDALLDLKVVNEWYDGRSHITVVHQKGRASFFRRPAYGGQSLDLQIGTIGAARAWDFDAEMNALVRFRQLVKKWPFECYMMTGSFLETSPRSKVIYLFRRCRPTIAFTCDGTDKLRILAALCMHPIGYYARTFAGVMVPTDDVIAHLMMMRADERRFWSKANHHHLWEPEAGC